MKTHVTWIIVVIAALFAGKSMRKTEVRTVEKPVEVVRTEEVIVEKPIEVIKEVPKEVVKIVERTVEVPAAIPEPYKNALNFLQRFNDAKFVSQKDGLAGVESVRVAITLSEDIKKIISESEIRTKFEITLRRSGVPINEKSRFTLSHYQDGFTKGDPTLVFSCSTTLNEHAFAFRDGGPISQRYVDTWRDGNYGFVGISKARETLLTDAESAAETFANDWLSMNSKK